MDLGLKLIRGGRGRLVPDAPVLYVHCPVPGHEADYELFRSACEVVGAGFEVMAVNRAVAELPHEIRHAVSLHGGLFFEAPGPRNCPLCKQYDPDAAGMVPGWLGIRSLRRYPVTGIRVHSNANLGACEFVWDLRMPCPSSGFYGLLLGKAAGYGLIVTNARLSGKAYGMYRRKWEYFKGRGFFDNIRHFGREGMDGWVPDLIGRCGADDLQKAKQAEAA